MADQNNKTETDAKTTDNENIFSDTIGEDWGEAFVADDTLFSPDEEASSQFFLDDDGSPSPSPVKEKASDQRVDDTPTSEKKPFNVTKLLALIISTNRLVKARILSYPRPVQTVIGVGSLGLIILILAIVFILPGHKPPPSKTNELTTAPQKTPVPSQKASKTISQATPPSQSTPKVQDQPIIKPAPPATPPPHRQLEKVNKKWPLPTFIVAISSPKQDKTPTIITVNITLLLVLDEDELPTEDQKTFIRDLIFQFYNNQPLSEINRFSLARGDMKRELRNWIEKQWPTIPLSAIVFNRYQIL